MRTFVVLSFLIILSTFSNAQSPPESPVSGTFFNANFPAAGQFQSGSTYYEADRLQWMYMWGWKELDGLALYFYQEGLIIYDVSDPDNRQLKLRMLYEKDQYYYNFVKDRYLYQIGKDDGQLRVFDIYFSENPEQIAELEGVGKLFVSSFYNDILFFSTLESGLYLIDASPATTQDFTGHLDSETGKLYMCNGYLVTVADKLKIIDIRDPADPRIINEYSVTDHWISKSYRFEVYKHYAILVVRNSGIHIVDLNNPYSLRLVAILGEEYSLTFTRKGDEYLVIGTDVYDITDMENPVLTDLDPDELDSATSLASSVNAVPEQMDIYISPDRTHHITAGDNFLAVSGLSSIIRLLDTTDPLHPVLTDTVSVGLRIHWSVQDLAAQGNDLFIAKSSMAPPIDPSGLFIFDCSDITDPKLHSFLELSLEEILWFTYCQVDGDYVYIKSRFPKVLYIVDISDISNPFLAGTLPVPRNIFNFAVSGDYIYVPSDEPVLTIIDVTDKANPFVANEITLASGPITGLFAEGDRLYYSGGYDEADFCVADISDPLNPVLLYSWDKFSNGLTINNGHLMIKDDIVYQSGDSRGFRVFDVSGSGSPELISDYPGRSNAMESVLVGDCIYLANRYSLSIFAPTDTPPAPFSRPVAENFRLNQNYPNPFNPLTTISFELESGGSVTLVIYNTLGQKIKTILSKDVPAGIHQLRWDGTNSAGKRVPSGVYIYRLQTPEGVQTKKMLFLK